MELATILYNLLWLAGRTTVAGLGAAVVFGNALLVWTSMASLLEMASNLRAMHSSGGCRSWYKGPRFTLRELEASIPQALWKKNVNQQLAFVAQVSFQLCLL